MKISHHLKIFFGKFFKAVGRHKIVSALIIVVVVGGGYYAYGKLNGARVETRYVLAAVTRGTLVATAAGSGQVSALNQVDVKPKASGDVSFIGISEGREARAGAVVLQLDSRFAQKVVRDAEANLASARLSLEKIKKPADALSLIQAGNAVTEATESKQNAEDDVEKAYDDGFSAVANAFLDLPEVITGLNSVLFGTGVNGAQGNADAYFDLVKNNSRAEIFREGALSGYQTARAAYDKNLEDYKNASRYSDRVAIVALINKTYETARAISEAIKNEKSFLDLVNDVMTSIPNSRPPAVLATHESSLQTYTGTINSHLGNLLNIKNSIRNDEDTIISSDRTIEEKTEALAKLKAGPDTLDIQSQELAVKQRENALLDARETLADYYVRAPFDGVVAKINVKKGDPVSSGAVAFTVITAKKIAQVSLNEVDVAKIKIGQKATLTFDAFSNLTMTGEVVQIDTIGAVSQGVVTYSVKIALDTEDNRVKSAMSVSAAIITDTKQDVLLVPNAAVKSQGDARYVEMFGDSESSAQVGGQGIVSRVAPRREPVEVGLSNDSMTEIISGVNEGDLVVVRTVTGSSQAQTQTQRQGSGFGIPGLGGGIRR